MLYNIIYVFIYDLKLQYIFIVNTLSICYISIIVIFILYYNIVDLFV